MRPGSGSRGEQGSLVYAIQGNVLTGDPVVFEAERTLLSSTGDLGQRVMAAMETARAFGGDGRCSCSYGAPTNCGSPPPNFDKSAHVAFLIISRIGDEEGHLRRVRWLRERTLLRLPAEPRLRE